MEASFNEQYVDSLSVTPKEMIEVTKQELFVLSFEQ